MKFRYFLLLLPVLLLLVSCGSLIDTPPTSMETGHDGETETGTSLPVSPFISDMRISVRRCGLSPYFTLSETGIYCFARENSGNYVLYCDKNSNQFVKLCMRIDCEHSDENCDAYIDASPSTLGYYKGKLYFLKNGTMEIETKDGAQAYVVNPDELWQMDPDGRNKRVVKLCWEIDEGITGVGDFNYFHGYYEASFEKIDKNGIIERTRRYISLDDAGIFTETAGSIFTSLEDPTSGGVLYCDGKVVIIQDNQDKKNPVGDDGGTYMSLYAWNPIENTIAYIGDRPYKYGNSETENTVCYGYYGTECAFIVEDGIVKQWDYQSHTGVVLFDTGSKAKMELVAFPDCLVINDRYDYGELPDGLIPEVTIRFYSWNYQSLGECILSFDKEQNWYGNFVFGETENRILLVKSLFSTRPDYYIEKSDFGSGHITLHPYYYPDMDLRDY